MRRKGFGSGESSDWGPTRWVVSCLDCDYAEVVYIPSHHAAGEGDCHVEESATC